MFDSESTIAAIATPPGQGAVAIIRLSGSNAIDITRRLFSKPGTEFEHGRFYHGWIIDPNDGLLIDEVLVLIFKAPHSVTGEDVVEIQCHGGEYISQRILQKILEQGADFGARLALPGEFTKRGFLNGKLDLTQAESVMDLVSAQNDQMVAMATSNLKNRSLGDYVEKLQQKILQLQMHIVASVDFPDEVDEPDRSEFIAAFQEAINHARYLAVASEKNKLIREGMTVAILGLPNAGKSSLFNALLTSERALVTDIAGTTRDVLRETLQINGVPVTLIDTAGIRESEDHIEILGVERSWQASDEAHIILYVVDASVGVVLADRNILSKLPKDRTIVIANKMDYCNTAMMAALPKDAIKISASNREGLPQIYEALSNEIKHLNRDVQQAAISLNYRQRACIDQLLHHLLLVEKTLTDTHLPLDLVSVPLTDALRKTEELTGKDTTEEVLDAVFAEFCVGK